MTQNKPHGLGEYSKFLSQSGFKNFKSDTSIFIYQHDDKLLYVLAYVNDILITGSHSTLLHQFVHSLVAKFSLNDLRDLNYFLGIEVIPTNTSLFLSHQKCIRNFLQNTDMEGAKKCPTSLSTTSYHTVSQMTLLPHMQQSADKSLKASNISCCYKG